MEFVLDASAVLCMLLNQEGAEAAIDAIESGSRISSVNLSEVAGRLALIGMAENAVRQTVSDLPLIVVPVDAELAFLAALMLPVTKRFGLSLGDRICLALAQQLDTQAVTADRVWGDVGPLIGVKVKLIR